ncbi:hypothetical protein ACLOJK_013323 [Asimina triloba]
MYDLLTPIARAFCVKSAGGLGLKGGSFGGRLRINRHTPKSIQLPSSPPLLPSAPSRCSLSIHPPEVSRFFGDFPPPGKVVIMNGFESEAENSCRSHNMKDEDPVSPNARDEARGEDCHTQKSSLAVTSLLCASVFMLENDEDDYEESGGGNRLLGFMFGNVDGSGDLDVDYLDEAISSSFL